MSLYSEINEQPARLADLLTSQRGNVERLARAILSHHIDYVFLAARGTSDNAGRYANYLWGARNGLPLALATPSLFTYYRRPPRLKNALVVGVSQSGQSPDIVAVVEEGRRQGCLSLAITNAPRSPLAKAADFVVDVCSGPEYSIAATKSYTAELFAIAMLSAAMTGRESAWKELGRVPKWIERVLVHSSPVEGYVQRYRFMQQCVVLGRGFNYATAYEWALKLKELTYVEAEPYSSADFQHGPIAMIERGYPVMAVAPRGRVFDSMMKVLAKLHVEFEADLVVISDNKKALSLAQVPIPLPAGLPEWLTPLVSIVPCQLFSYWLAAAKGFNVEKPRSLRKVTQTR